jgi:PAS domain S-box-containing protein
MRGRRQLILLLIIMLVVALGVGGIVLFYLYRTAFEQQRERLTDLARSRARMIEAVARFDEKYSRGYPEGPFAATLEQLRQAHAEFAGIGETGEFLLGHRENDRITYLFQPRHNADHPTSVPFDAAYAEPMRRALSGESGTTVSRNYHGAMTLSAYEPVSVYGLGVVVKIDVSEIQAPFLRGGLMAAAAGLLFISVGIILFFTIGNPIIRRLEESEEKYRNMFESIADRLILATMDGVVLDVNPSGCLAYGFSREEFIGRNMKDFVHPDQHKAVEDAYKRVAQGHVVRRESVHLKGDGTTFPVDVQLSPITHKGQAAILATARDISERKQAEQALRESEQRLRDLAENIQEVFWVGVPQWNQVTYVSPAYEKVWGRSRESLYEQPFSWMDTIVDEDREKVRERLEKMTRDGFPEPLIGEFRIVRPDGSIRWILDRAFPVWDEQGEIRRLVGVAEDITERKLAEEALRESEARYRALSQSLEETVLAKVAELRQAESLAAIGGLVSVVAHEIRNPLQNINMGLEMLKMKIGETPETLEIFQEIDYGVNLLSVTVNELLDYARPLRLQPSPIRVGALVRQAVKVICPYPENITINTEFEKEETELLVDIPKVVRVLVNIMSNAIEAMPEGGTIWIRSEMQEEEDYLKLTISDNGPGIDEEQLDRVFEPFFTTKTRGTGLGLSICKKIVEAHSGILRIHSKEGEGTTLTILLPLMNQGKDVPPVSEMERW